MNKVLIRDYYSRLEKSKINRTFKNQLGKRLGDYICLKDFDTIIDIFDNKYKETNNTKYLNAVINWRTKKIEFMRNTRINND